MTQPPMLLQLSPRPAAIFLLSGCEENGQSRVQTTEDIRQPLHADLWNIYPDKIRTPDKGTHRTPMLKIHRGGVLFRTEDSTSECSLRLPYSAPPIRNP